MLTNETLETLKTRRSCRAYKPDQITEALRTRPEIEDLASLYHIRQCVFLIGRVVDFAATQEASLKL